MLNLTDEQRQDFKNWQKETLKDISIMRATIQTAIPTEWKENNFYKTLEKVEDVIKDFSVANTFIRYKKEEVKSEMKAGSCLREYICTIQKLTGNSALLAVRLDALEEIFEI